MWDFFETVRHRHSVRKFRCDMPVEPEKLHAILEMACAAPSAGDLQSYHIYAVQDDAKRELLSATAPDQPFIAEAPLSLVFCSDKLRAGHKYGQRGEELYALQDATIAAAYAQLSIVAAGLGSTWVGHFDEEKLKASLGIASELTPVAILCVGYPAELPGESPRRHLDEVVTKLV